MTATRASNWTVHGGLLFVSTRQGLRRVPGGRAGGRRGGRVGFGTGGAGATTP